MFFGKCNNELYAQERTNQLKKFDGDKWNLVCNLPGKALVTSTAIAAYTKDTALLIATLKDGLFLLIGNKLVKEKLRQPDKLLQNVRINTLQRNH